MPDDVEAIRALVGAYAERLDAGDLDGVAELFSSATFRSAQGGRVREGAAAVRSVYEPVVLYEDGTPRTKHVLANLVIDVDTDGRHAQSSCAFTVLQQVGDSPLNAVLAGRYEDRFECRDGVWRFTERVVQPDLLGDLSQHMAARRPT